MRCIDPVGDMLILYSASENVQNLFAIGKLHGMKISHFILCNFAPRTRHRLMPTLVHFQCRNVCIAQHSRPFGPREGLRACFGVSYFTPAIMASSRTFYDVLGVGSHAQKGEIKENYRRLALRHHPDKDLGNPHATAGFQEVCFTIYHA